METCHNLRASRESPCASLACNSRRANHFCSAPAPHFPPCDSASSRAALQSGQIKLETINKATGLVSCFFFGCLKRHNLEPELKIKTITGSSSKLCAKIYIVQAWLGREASACRAQKQAQEAIHSKTVLRSYCLDSRCKLNNCRFMGRRTAQKPKPLQGSAHKMSAYGCSE